MPKRRSDDEEEDLLSVPLPIQTFLWRQTSPFIRPKFGRLREPSCMEQREACKSFEKVLVQNIQFGLSPSLTDAIRSISRWRLVRAAFPHILHCSSALLYTRKNNCMEKLGAAETKLMYTLHWILLDAAEECADAEMEKGIFRSTSHYLLPVTAIQIFIYLFAPLASYLKHTDFLSSFRLENGIKIWEPIWNFRHPDVPCFTTHVRPKRNILKARRDRKSQTKFGDVFLGADELSPENGQLSMGSSDTSQAPPGASPASSMSPSIAKETSGSNENKKIQEPEPKEEICEVCSTPFKKSQANAETLSCKCPMSPDAQRSQRLDPSAKKTKPGGLSEICMATYLDVAVLRCLFVSQWLEEGVHWGLLFLYNRLRSVAEEHSHVIHPRKRSNSLPIPQIEVSLYQSPEQKRREFDGFADSERTYFLDSPFPPPSHHSSMQELRRSSLTGSSDKPKHKRMKIGDFRLFVEEKLRLSERLLDKIGRDDSHVSVASEFSQDIPISFDVPSKSVSKHRSSNEFTSMTDLSQPPRPKSALALLDHDGMAADDTTPLIKMEMIRGKSMPSLHLSGDKTVPKAEIMSKLGKFGMNLSVKKTPAFHTHSVPNPIITVTEHSPVASVQFFLNQDSNDSPRDESPPLSIVAPCRQMSITRSQTDSNISYTNDELIEAPGTTHYITKNGDICFHVVLKAVHAVTLRDNTCSLRVCEVILNLLDLLINLNLLPPKNDNGDQDSLCEKGADSSEPKIEKPKSEKDDVLTVHELFLDSIVKVIKHLGCPHGCGEGHRSPAADMLRSQAQNTLVYLYRTDEANFQSFLRHMAIDRSLAEIVDIFHAFVGFCSEPGTVLSPLGQKRTSTGSSQDSSSRLGYANNFGAGFAPLGPKGIEGVVIMSVFKPFVLRLVNSVKELKNQENMALYCDVRQLISYIRDNHGGVFRRVALCGLIDSSDRPFKKDKQMTPTTRIVRHTKSVDHEDAKDPLYSPALFVVDETTSEKTSRKSFFRKRGIRKVPSAQSFLEDKEDFPSCASPALGQSSSSLLLQHKALASRLSFTDEDSLSLNIKRGSKFQIVNWLKGDRPRSGMRLTDSDGSVSPIPPEHYPGTEPLSRRASTMNRNLKLGHKSSSQMSLTLLKARKRMEDHLNKIGFGRSKNKHGSFEEPLDLSRRNSYDFEHSLRDGEMLLLKESKLVNIAMVKRGMHCFSFLLESTQPGTLPDPPLMAAALDLNAPVVARAALYLECAHFVHRCNKGHWPTWMKLNLPVFRPSGPLANRGTPSGLRRTHILQKAAGRMFYQWGEAIGARMEEMLSQEPTLVSESLIGVLDDTKRRQLRIEDEEEDFLDEASVNSSKCPFALKMAACQLLLEITAFLRETFQYLPQKSSRMSTREKHTFEPRNITANRRWSMALSSLGISQNSAHSLVSLAEQTHPGAGERRISFVLHEAEVEAESENSSNTTVTVQGEEGTAQEDNKKATSGRRIAQGRPHLLRRSPVQLPGHNSSFKRRSLKLKKTGDRKTRPRSSTFAEDEEDVVFKRTESICSRRKVSAVSDRSDTSERADVSGEESPGVQSDDQPPESPIDVLESDDGSITKNLPWLKVIVQVSNTLNFSCPHNHYCLPNCYRRQMRACNRMVKAVRKVYGDDFGLSHVGEKQQEDKEDSKKDKKLKKIITAPSSPLRRKASIPHNMDRLEKSQDVPHLGAPRSLHSSTTFLAHDVEIGHTDNKTVRMKPKEEKPKEEDPILKYLKTQAKGLFHSPMSSIVKGAVILSDEVFVDIMNVAWELVLESDQQVASTSAIVFILSSVKAPDQASEVMMRELHHEDPSHRLNAILRFHALWKFRYHCWPCMEDGAHLVFKVPPPAIEFTLPSPKISLESIPVADPPWMPHVKAKVEEVTISQDQSLQRSFVTATKTRRKQQMELVHRALQQEDEKKRTERENYYISSVAVNIQAAYEPALYHSIDDHEEGDEDQLTERSPAHHMQVAHSLFPSCLCSAALPIINLLDDPQVSPEGIAVYEAAYKVMWHCLVEDSTLFLRHILEKLTREKQDTMVQILRRVFRFVPRLPAQAAYTVYNYLVGYIMFYVRAPVEGGQELIGNALSIMWLVIPSVQGLFLKDLKQILRKEQCDATLLITANVPSAKKIIVHGPDVGGIPSQFPIHEDTQFSHILQDSIDFFGIDDEQQNFYFLVDTKTNQMHNLNAFVRDFYFFKRSQYPQLSLVHMNPNEAFDSLQRQAFMLRFVELGKVLMSLSIVKSQFQAPQRVLFLHDELMKLPSFPRKALETDFGLYTGSLGKELLGMDTMHKMVWVRLVARMFEVMAGFFAHSSDIHLFVNVINGAVVLHCEDASVLRLCLATMINAAQQFKNIFAANGYLLIMPTLLRIYSNHQTNGLLCRSIEFVCKQFYIMHRKPFTLQMFGSVAPILDMDTDSNYGDASKVQPKAIFQLLLSMGQHIVDPLDILELVEGEKPLRALDFCYQMDPDTITVLDAIALCVTVVSYSADSQRGHQMLTILEAILPFYLKHLQNLTTRKETPGGPRTELQMIHNVAVCMKTLITNCEALARNYTGPQRAIDLRGSSIKNASRGAVSPPFEVDEDSHSRFMSDSYYSSRKQQQYESEDSELMRTEFRRPRDTLLNVVCEFLTKCSARLADLSKKLPDLSSKATELLDVKCHLRLAEVAHSLLKVSPYDPTTMAGKGLHRYMNEVLPHSEWAQESMRPALIMVLRRLDKTFNKISKKPAIRRLVDWEAARSLLKGVYMTLYRHPYIAHLPHLKSLIAVCQSILIGDSNASFFTESVTNLVPTVVAIGQCPPPGFCSVVVRLVAMQMSALGDTLTLESLCGGGSVISSTEKMEVYLMNLILPMCIRICSDSKDVPKLRQFDVSYAMTVVLCALMQPTIKQSGTSNKTTLDMQPEKSPARVRISLIQIGLLGLKIMITCFERQLSSDWHRIACCIRDMGNKGQGGIAFWSFLDFVVTHRTPLFVLLYPYIKYKILQTICDNEHEYYYQTLIREKLQGFSLPPPKCRGSLYADLMAEMKAIKEDMIARRLGGEVDRRKSVIADSHTMDVSQSASFNRGPNLGSSPPCASFTELGDDQQSVTKLGNPPGMISSGRSRLASITSITSGGRPAPQKSSPFSREWSSQKERYLPPRGLSIRLHSRESTHRVVERFLRRTSFPFPEEDGNSSQEILSLEHTASSEPRLYRTCKSTYHIRKKGSKRSSGNLYGEMSDGGSGRDDGQDSGPSMERLSGVQSPDDELKQPRHRLQRQKAQSRKTFRFRKSRRGTGFAPHPETGEGGEEIAMEMPLKQPMLAEEEALATATAAQVPEVAFQQVKSEDSVDYRAPRRRGAMHLRSRSASPSPERPEAPADAYIAQCESSADSLNSENTALLKGDGKQHDSSSSLLMIFPAQNGESNCA